MSVSLISKDEIKKCFKRSLVAGEQDRWKCLLCPETKDPIRQRQGSGFTNLRNHIKNVHPDWTTKQPVQSTFEHYIRPKSSNIYGWIKKVVLNCQPLSIVENQIELEFTILKPICRKTLKAAISKTFELVFKKVIDLLPERFCLCFDAWTENCIHFVAIYAIFNDAECKKRTILLSFGNLLDESNWSANNYADTIVTLLGSLNKSIDNVVCLVGDNCATNRSLSNILELPLIGCASHKLNLAVEKYIQGFPEIQVINQLMIKLSTPLKMAKLKLRTALRPISRNVTRWSSCFNMLERFFEIQEYLDITDPDLAFLMPNCVQILQLKNVMVELTLLNQLAVFLQSPSLTLLEARNCFDKVMINHPPMKQYLGSEAKIVHSPVFESSIIKVLNDRESELTVEEKICLIKLENNELRSFSTVTFDSNPYICVASNAINTPSKYINLNFIPPTSNIVERLFSLAGRIYSDNRKSLDNSTLEEIIFLNQNKDLWDGNIVDKAME